MHRSSIERWLQRTELIQKDAQAPHIRLKAVGATLNHLRTQVVGRAHNRMRQVHSVLHLTGDTKITKFYNTLRGDEDILGFDVAMQNFSIVNMLNAITNLCEPIKDLIL
jgi:hypothetical protein